MFPVLAQEYLEHQLRRITPKGYCYLVDLAPSKEGGYAQVSVDRINKFTTLGKVLGCAAGLYIDEVLGRGVLGVKTEISHRCHNPLCTVPAHVLLETSAKNNGRKNCKVFTDCAHSDEGCGLKQIVCEHEPMCIKFIEGYETWEEFLELGCHRKIL